jgi:phage terminase large subunit GpA-like protein
VIDHYPGSNRPIEGGLKLLRINTTLFKDKLAAKLQVAPADPGAWHLNAETTRPWAEMLCAETVNDKGLWEVIKNRPNHAWDLGVYHLALADLLGLKHRRPEIPKPAAVAPENTARKKAPGWVGVKKKGWMQ